MRRRLRLFVLLVVLLGVSLLAFFSLVIDNAWWRT